MSEGVRLVRKYIDNEQYKDVFLIRNGSFVGLYRFSMKVLTFKLWRKINSEKCGCRTTIPLRSRYQLKGRSQDWLSDYIYANETYPIPDGYNLNNKEHLLILDRCLGLGSGKVTNRLRIKQPLWKKCGHNMTYAE
jgi:hypothetical protein